MRYFKDILCASRCYFIIASCFVQEILDLDSENYHALVFAGKCSFELERKRESKDYYKRATLISKSDPLAWKVCVHLVLIVITNHLHYLVKLIYDIHVSNYSRHIYSNEPLLSF